MMENGRVGREDKGMGGRGPPWLVHISHVRDPENTLNLRPLNSLLLLLFTSWSSLHIHTPRGD